MYMVCFDFKFVFTAESQRTQRGFTFNFLLRGQKVKKHALRVIGSILIFTPSHKIIFQDFKADCPICLPSSQRQT
jgi:hypothetical protein